MLPRIVVIGGGGIDYSSRCAKIPTISEIVPAGELISSPGGKGATQSVTAARLGAEVHFIGCLGKDDNGDRVLTALNDSGVNTEFVERSYKPTSTSLIIVNYDGDNITACHPGANLDLSIETINKAKGIIAEADIVVCQLENHNSVLEHSIATARQFGVPVLLNSSPAIPFDINLFTDISVLIMNQIEADYYTNNEILTLEDAKSAAEDFIDEGVESVIITLGRLGCLTASRDGVEHIFAPSAKAKDTTSAGDVFIGAFAWAIAQGDNIMHASDIACKCASLSIQYQGAIDSVPDFNQIKKAFGNTLGQNITAI